jgi:hypothetical protein
MGEGATHVRKQTCGFSSLAAGHRSPAAGRRSRFHRDCLHKAFRMNVCIMWVGGVPLPQSAPALSIPLLLQFCSGQTMTRRRNSSQPRRFADRAPSPTHTR